MFRPGSWVGAGRWSNSAAHPDQWGRPIGGQVVAADSPAAWANTPEFPVSNPDGAQVMNHITELRKQGKLEGAIPILWDLGNGIRVIKWEKVSSLRPYGDEMILYKARKLMRLDELAHPRREKKRPLASFLPEPHKHLAPAEA
jgi:hypothetical protein